MMSFSLHKKSMKTKIFAFLILFYILIQPDYAQNIQVHHPESTILLFHPTVRNIQTIQYLTESGIFPVPENFHIIGVYHKYAAYNYAQTATFIEEKKICNLSLVEISDTLFPGNIFQINQSSSLFTHLFEQSAGAIFFGGPDIPPVCYGEKTSLLTEITDPFRHYLELSFIFYLLGGFQSDNFTPLIYNRSDYAVLGICLGMQSINVATGGSLYQDIPTELYNVFTSEDVLLLHPDLRHRNYFIHNDIDPDLIYGHFHQLSYAKGSIIDILNNSSENSPNIWSSHHQAIKKIGKNLVPVAYSTDSMIIEAVRHAEFQNVFGVQFHPEVNSIYNDTIKLKQLPRQSVLKSYAELFPGSSGYDFHKNFWKYISEMFFGKNSE